MSAPTITPAKSSAAAVDARAAAWLDRKDRGCWTEKDEADLAAWLDEDPINRITFWRIEAAWNRTERLAALRPSKPVRGKGTLFFRVAAAALLVAAIVGGVWTYLAQPSSVTYATSIGGRETVMLADGSRIELNTDTAIRLSDTANARNVWLDKGEAYFQVTHNPARPLTVLIGKHRVTDLGTKFVIRREPNRTDVSVLEGSVSMDAVGASPGSKALTLLAGDAVVALADKMSVTRKSTTQLSDELGWRRGVIVFDSTPLATAAEEVSRYNSVRVVVAGEQLRRLPVTGTVSANDPEEFLRMARTVFGLRAKKMNGGYVISR